MTNLELNAEYRCFGGKVAYYSHDSQICNSPMRFALYLPPQAESQAVPVLYYLSGLTCSEENFMVKAGAQKYAALYGIALVVPDTSPRNTGIPGEDQDWDLGSGAGFYVDATQQPWQPYYQMYSYVTQELPQLIGENFPVMGRQGVFGHSMGGHGALICALKNPDRYLSVSAFAPIAAPMQSPWGQKAFRAYLGENQSDWRQYDASELVLQTQFGGEILIDQGTEDSFYQQKQLLPEVFERVCQEVQQPLKLRFQSGYDHSYYFIASFIEEHFKHHARILCK